MFLRCELKSYIEYAAPSALIVGTMKMSSPSISAFVSGSVA